MWLPSFFIFTLDCSSVLTPSVLLPLFSTLFTAHTDFTADRPSLLSCQICYISTCVSFGLLSFFLLSSLYQLQLELNHLCSAPLQQIHWATICWYILKVTSNLGHTQELLLCSGEHLTWGDSICNVSILVFSQFWPYQHTSESIGHLCNFLKLTMIVF